MIRQIQSLLKHRPTTLAYVMGLPLSESTRERELHRLKDHGQQDERELKFLLRHIAGSRSILEIGSCFGQTLRLMASVCPKAKIRSIDLGLGIGIIEGMNTGKYLLQTMEDLKSQGHDTAVCFNNSHSPLAVQWARKNGPYDFIFIDGDHSYEGVKSEWLGYGPLGKMVGFHDIASKSVGKLWLEIKRDYRVIQCIESPMGVGIVLPSLPLDAA